MKRASTSAGIAIIAIGLLILLGGIITDGGSNGGLTITKKDNQDNDGSESSNNNEYPEDDYLFYLNNTELGRQNKVTESYPNFVLGEETRYNNLLVGNSFRLNANPFTANEQRFTVQLSEPGKVSELLIYFDPKRLSGEAPLLVRWDGNTVVKSQASSAQVPIRVPLNIRNTTNASAHTLGLSLEKPAWYALFNWNKLDVTEFKIVELVKDRTNRERAFSFNLDKSNLQRVNLDMTVSCESIRETSAPIKVEVNGYIVSNQNPDCTSNFNRISANNISHNILNDGYNDITFESSGFYKVAYSVSKIYFNDRDSYKFVIDDFSDLIDVIMYGDFDKSVIDLRINEQTLSLTRDEIKDILPYLEYGTNEIEFITKPVKFEEFVIEKNEFNYRD